MAETPLEIKCWRQGPWTGRGDDVSAVLDLMIHDLDLVHTLVPGAVDEVQAPRPDRNMARMPTKSPPSCTFANGTVARAGHQPHRRRAASAACAPSMPMAWSKSISSPATSPTPRPRPLGALEMGDPLGESVAGFRRRRPGRHRRAGDAGTGGPGAGDRAPDRGGGGSAPCRCRPRADAAVARRPLWR